MARKRLRLLKRVPPMIGVCEGCLAQFRSIFTGRIAAEAEIRVRFAAHKCMRTQYARTDDAASRQRAG